MRFNSLMFNFSLKTRWKLNRRCARELISNYFFFFLREIAFYSIFLNRKERDKNRVELYFERSFAEANARNKHIFPFVISACFSSPFNISSSTCYFRAKQQCGRWITRANQAWFDIRDLCETYAGLITV